MLDILLAMLFYKRCHGYSLLEVLIAALVISIGLLGIAGSAIVSLRHSEQAYLHSVAITQAQSMIERLRVNHSQAARERELKLWNQENKYLLPKGKGVIACKTRSCKIVLTWSKGGELSLSYIPIAIGF